MTLLINKNIFLFELKHCINTLCVRIRTVLMSNLNTFYVKSVSLINTMR